MWPAWVCVHEHLSARNRCARGAVAEVLQARALQHLVGWPPRCSGAAAASRQVLSGGVAEVLRRERESVAEVLRRGDAPVAPEVLMDTYPRWPHTQRRFLVRLRTGVPGKRESDPPDCGSNGHP